MDSIPPNDHGHSGDRMTRMLRMFVLALCALAALYLYLGSDWGGPPGAGFELTRPPAEGSLDLDPESVRTRIGPLTHSDERLLSQQRSAYSQKRGSALFT